MAKIKVTCDSTCDLTRELYEKYDIEVLPLGVCLGEEFRADGVDITAQEIYDYADRTGMLPKTSAISVGCYQDCFRNYVDQGYEVIHINLSAELSSCYQNACIAAQSVGSVYPIDSRNLSTGSGCLAVLASEMAAEGKSAREIVDCLNSCKQHLDTSFVLQTLEYLHKGGRCSGVAVFGANVLHIRPEIVVTDGSMHVGRKYRGSMEKSILSYIRGRLEGQTDIRTDRIFVTHSGVPADIVEKAIRLVKELQPFREVIETTAGCTISSHCGPNCLGVVVMRKQPQSH